MSGDLTDERRIQAYAADSDVAKFLFEEFRYVDKESIVPAMFAWLYYGKCYETMVLQFEAVAAEDESREWKQAHQSARKYSSAMKSMS